MVTGGTGFIGAHTVRALLDARHEVRLLVRDPALLDAVLRPLGVDAVDPVVGDASDAGDFFVAVLKHGAAVGMRGAWSVVDVRDVAAVHAALVVRPGAGPRRYTVGGTFLEYRDALTMIEQVTGRRLRRIDVPVAPLRALAWVAEAIGRVVPLSSYLTPEALASVVDAVPVDDSRTTTELR